MPSARPDPRPPLPLTELRLIIRPLVVLSLLVVTPALRSAQEPPLEPQEDREDPPPSDVPEIVVTGTLEEIGVPVVPLTSRQT